MRGYSVVGGHNFGSRAVRAALIILILNSNRTESLKGEAKSEFFSLDTPPVPTSLCPAVCTCKEEKLRLQTAVDQDLGSQNLQSKPEILKNGIKVQCQKPGLIVSVKKLNLQPLLVENIVQLDLAGNGLAKLTAEDFAQSGGIYSALQKLVLKNNQIADIGAGTFDSLTNLKSLDLSNNQLANLSSTVVQHLPNLERIKLNGNPLKCDCRMSSLLTYASSRNVRLQGTCSEPARLKDRSLARLVVEELGCPPDDPVVVDIRPDTNQIVFEGDPLRLTCKFRAGRPVSPSWLHRNANNQTATVSAGGGGAGGGGAVELTSTSRGTDHGTETESQLLIRHLLPRHGGWWACSWGGRTASVEVTVLSLTTPTCASQVTTSNKGRYSWPRTMANLKVTLPCQANPTAQTFRLCAANGQWLDADLNSCFYLSEVTKVLEQFAKTNLTLSKTSALESGRRLRSYLADVVRLTDPHQAVFVTQTLHNYVEASGKHPQLLPIVMDIYSILIGQDAQVLADSRHGLVGILQQASTKIPEFEYRSDHLVIEKRTIAAGAATCTWRRIQRHFNATCGRNSSAGTMEASIRIPLISDGGGGGGGGGGGVFAEQDVVLTLVLSTNAFVGVKMQWPLATPVLGVHSGPVTNLVNRTTPFMVTVRLNRPVGPDQRLVGARWNQYTDQWSADQCQTLKWPEGGSGGGRGGGDPAVTFQCCCGFGFFAAFTVATHEIDSDDNDNQQQTIPEQVTTGSIAGSSAGRMPGHVYVLLPSPVYVGSVIGLLCHLTAFLCYLIHRKQLCMTQPTRHSLINIWISVSLLMMAFTLGVRPVIGKMPCQIAGLLLHYLTLSSLLWMVVNASSLYKQLTKSVPPPSSSSADPETADSSVMEDALASGHDSPAKPALRFYLIGWGIPLIVVGIAGAIHLEQYHSARICFLAWTPSLGAIGLPSAILILLVLTFHLLTWCFLRHTSRMAAIHQKQLAGQQQQEEAIPADAGHESGGGGTAMVKEKKSGGYVELTAERDGDVTSCPSNVTNQVTETSDLASLSSDHHERMALLAVQLQRGEAEGGGGPLHSGRSESERPLLLVTSSAASSNGWDRMEEENGGMKTDADEQGHSNPLMVSFTDDGDSKRRGCASSLAPSLPDTGRPTYRPVTAEVMANSAPATAEPESDEKSSLSQLRGQFVFLILFCLTWLSALCVVARPFRAVLPQYDEMVSSLCYAVFSSATGLHAVLFHLLTRKDVCTSCFEPHPHGGKDRIAQPQPLPPIPPPPQDPAPVDQVDSPAAEVAEAAVDMIDPAYADAMNVTIMDPSMVVNSFYDARQSKTARRFFQKQKLLQQMQNNQLHRHHHHHHHRHSRHSSGHSINNQSAYWSHSSHSPMTEEALLNASTSTKAKVSNVNIHVEMGAYDWHELQSRISDQSWTKSGKQMLPAPPLPAGSADRSSARPSDKSKRKRHVPYHQRLPKKTKLEDQSVPVAEVAASAGQVTDQLPPEAEHEEVTDQLAADDEEETAFQKRETSV